MTKLALSSAQFENVIELIKSEIDSLKDTFKQNRSEDYSTRLLECKKAIKKLKTIPPSNKPVVDKDGLIAAQQELLFFLDERVEPWPEEDVLKRKELWNKIHSFTIKSI